MTLPELYANNFQTTLVAPMTNVTTSMSVAAFAPTTLQSGGQFRVIVDGEIMIVTAGASTTTWTVTRGAEGTTATTHSFAASVTHILTSTSLLSAAASGTKVYYATVYGVKADGKTVTDAAITGGLATLTSATASFTSLDVGKLCVVVGAGTPITTTTTAGLTSGVGFTSLLVNALGSALPPGGLQISSGANTQTVVTSGALSGATTIPLIGAYVCATSAALTTGGAITSIPCAPLVGTLASGTVALVYLDSSNVLHTQTFTTAGAALQATSIPVTSLTPNFAYPISTPILGSPTSVTANFSYLSGSTVSTMIPALSTTIQSVTNGTTVTLAANAGKTVTGGECFYASNDTTSLQNCLSDADAVSQHGTVVLPEGDMGLSAPLTYSTSVTIRGVGVKDLLGQNGVFGASPAMNDAFVPNYAPYLEGSVLVQCTPNTDAIQCSIAGQATHVEKLGIRFAGRYQNTGHGLLYTQVTGYGNLNGNYEDVHVYGVDGNHYGFALTATAVNRMNGLRSYGGGGCWLPSGNAPSQPGNAVVTDCYFDTVIAGIGHALFIDGSGAGGDYSAMLFQNVNAQINNPTPAIANTVTPTSAQQCIMTIDWSTMSQMGWDMPSAQSQVSGSNVTFPAAGFTYRTAAPSNAPIQNPTPQVAPATATGYQNLYGTEMLMSFMFQMQPLASGSPSTTLNGIHNTGATAIVVTSSASFVAGQVIQIGDAAHDAGVLDFAIITSVVSNTLNVMNPGLYGISFNHSSGCTVQAGAALVVGQIAPTNAWPTNIRSVYTAVPVGGASLSTNTIEQFDFVLPAGYWYRLDYANAVRAWSTALTTLG